MMIIPVSTFWNGVIVTENVAFVHAQQQTEQLVSIVVVTGRVKLHANITDVLMPNAGVMKDGPETDVRYQVNLI